MSEQQEYLHIVIVGGGSAGWLSAGLLAAQLEKKTGLPHRITLIESPEVKTIGVGEGTWPSMRHTLQLIGLSEKTFLTECNGAFKQGSKFVNWGVNGSQDVYTHPFTNPAEYGNLDTTRFWHANYPARSFSEVIDSQSRIIEAGLAPKQASTPEFAGVCNYGYHFDAVKLAELLKSHCVKNLGVRFVRDHVDEVVLSGENQILGLHCLRQGLITGDLFIDCSGAKARLIGEHLKSPWHDVSSILFNDSAVAVQVPYAEDDQELQCATIATAQRYGWTWDINLPNRRGVGHVYSSQFGSVSEVENALERYIHQRLPNADLNKLSPRTIRFAPGYRPQPWKGNCIAVGMAAGFVEPLEASALAMTELALSMLVEQFPMNKQHLAFCAEQYNKRFNYRWERVVDFLKLHYVISEREDSAYWLEHKRASTCSPRLAQLLEHWRHVPPSRFDLIENEEVFSSASYQYVLYGMQPDYTRFGPFASESSDVRHCQQVLQGVEQRLKQCLQGLPNHRAYLESL